MSEGWREGQEERVGKESERAKQSKVGICAVIILEDRETN
jgi:hypothetical protein